uniref:Uncharacterized protein n=1 Tax=Electrophorus electricus TaxID=8005 RepID=A0A4W4GD47_ELEEL
MGCKEITEDCLTMYLESKPPTNQFLCRAYLCQAQLKSPQTAVMYYLKAIEVSKDKPGYHFLVFNASLLYFQSVRAFLRPGWRRHLVSSLTEVLRALEVVQESDYAWRSELMLLLVECLLDAGKEKEAAAYAKVTSDFIEQHKPELHPRIFSTQVVITPPSLSPPPSSLSQSWQHIFQQKPFFLFVCLFSKVSLSCSKLSNCHYVMF